ncbi:MAG TPA: PAC2 family protein [Candidatus Limnocylindrales bacterium]
MGRQAIAANHALRALTYPSVVALYHLEDADDLVAPTLIAAFDGWVDAGSAATTATSQLANGGVVATFDNDVLFDYRSRRPTLEIVDGTLSGLTWPELSIRRGRLEDRDILILGSAEPDFRWQEFSAGIVELARRLDIAQWISLGAIPAAVPHTRPVPMLGTASQPGLLKGHVPPGPAGVLRVPSAALSVIEMAVSKSGIPAVGYFAQVPHYVSGPYAPATVELLKAVGTHLGVDVPLGSLAFEAAQLRTRLDAAAAADEATREYIQRLESMVDEARLPAGDELISEIERFLRDRGGQSSSGGGLLN